MKFKEYIDAVTRVMTEHIAERDLLVAVTEGGSQKSPAALKDEYDRAFDYVKAALAANKELLGIFNGKPETIGVLNEKEIDKRDLERHVLKFRHDLRRFAPKASTEDVLEKKRETCERIVFRIVADINNALGVNDFGGIFGEVEEASYRDKFERDISTRQPPVPDEKPVQQPTRETTPQTAVVLPPSPKRRKKIKIPPQRMPHDMRPREMAQGPRPPFGESNGGLLPPLEMTPEMQRKNDEAAEARRKAIEEDAQMKALMDELRRKGQIQ